MDSMNNFNIDSMNNFNVANFLENAPIGLVLFSKSLGQNLEFNKVLVLNKVIVDQSLEPECPQRIIECVKYDDASKRVYFDEYGRIKKNICGSIINSDVDLMPDDVNGWDNYGIPALIIESYACIGKVLMVRFDPDDDTEFPWIVGDTAMWTFDNDWDYARFHKFDFSNVRFATDEEAQEFFDKMHKCGLDFKDGNPIKNG